MSTEKTNNNHSQQMDDKELEALLYEGFLLEGRVIPQTPEEVARVTKLMAQSVVELPADLLDAEAVLHGTMIPRRLPAPAIDRETADQLGCAARHGGGISNEVRAAMDRDRENAEQGISDGGV